MKKGSEKNTDNKKEKVAKEDKVSKIVKDTGKKGEKKNKHYIAEKKSVKGKKEKKENVFKKIVKYFKGVGKEVKRIRWTDRKDLLKYSICTLIFVLFFGLYFYAIDWIVLLVRSLAK